MMKSHSFTVMWPKKHLIAGLQLGFLFVKRPGQEDTLTQACNPIA